MSVMVVTSLGEIVIDLYTDRCPLTCKNFLKLCKIKYYNGCLFHTVQKDFTAQTGDPTGTGSGGDSVYRFLFGDQARFFKDEIHLDLKHSKTGMIAMASGGEDLNASQFYLTLRGDLDYLDGKHTVFGEIAEGLDTLERINEAYVDDKGRPYKNIRIKHTYILDDPFEDPPELAGFIPDASPEGKPKDEVDDEVRLEDDWVPMDDQLDVEELEDVIREKEAHSRAVVLESIGDIPDADVKPPENVLFVCKLNPVTEDEDLHTIFSRFGNVTSAEIIRDFKTGDSLCYAFIEFEDEEACIQAYKKMDNALIDDRRIKVDFSQSVSKLWNQFRRKGSKQGQGCFKCGSIDHIAKDCPGISTVNQRNFELKDDNKQRGGENNAKYDMVFDEDERSPKPEERRHERDDRSRKNEPSRRVPEGTKHREENRDTRTNRDSRGRRDRDYDERVTERRGDHHREHGRKDYKDPHSRADADNGKDGEDRRDDRKRSADYDGGYKRKSVDRDRYEDRDDRSHRRRDKEREDDSYRSRKEERERRRSPGGYDERDHDRRQRRDRR